MRPLLSGLLPLRIPYQGRTRVAPQGRTRVAPGRTRVAGADAGCTEPHRGVVRPRPRVRRQPVPLEVARIHVERSPLDAVGAVLPRAMREAIQRPLHHAHVARVIAVLLPHLVLPRRPTGPPIVPPRFAQPVQLVVAVLVVLLDITRTRRTKRGGT